MAPLFWPLSTPREAPFASIRSRLFMSNRRLATLLLTLVGTAAAAETWKLALPGYKYEFPRDHFSHDGFQTEWWYYTGNLRDESGHRFGFEMTFNHQTIALAPLAASEKPSVWRPAQTKHTHHTKNKNNNNKNKHIERLS